MITGIPLGDPRSPPLCTLSVLPLDVQAMARVVTLVTHAPTQQAPIRNSARENVVTADALMCTSSLTCLCDVQVNAWVGLWPKFV